MFSCCPITRLQCCAMLWRPIRFSRKNDGRFVFNLICFWWGAYFAYLVRIYLRIMLSITFSKSYYISITVRQWVTLVDQEQLSLLKHILGFYRSCSIFRVLCSVLGTIVLLVVISYAHLRISDTDYYLVYTLYLSYLNIVCVCW